MRIVYLLALVVYHAGKHEAPAQSLEDFRISHGMAAAFRDGRRVTVDASGRDVIIRALDNEIARLKLNEDVGTLIADSSGNAIVGLVFRFGSVTGRLTAATGARLLILSLDNAGKIQIKSVEVETILKAPWKKKWVIRIKTQGVPNAFTLTVGTMGTDGRGNYSSIIYKLDSPAK